MPSRECSWGGILPPIEDVLSEPEEHRGEILVAVLPTGYGKTSLPRRSESIRDAIMSGRVRLAHILPLRAIIAETAGRASKEIGPSITGYQAGVVAGGAVKSPYMTARYMIVTVDSYLMSFYGIPVYEFLRPYWHSDTVYATARLFNAMMLDEFHLMASGEGDARESETTLLAKQLASISPAAASQLRRGPLVVTTATMSPSILASFLRLVAEYAEKLGVKKPKVSIVGLGSKNHPYFTQLLNDVISSMGVEPMVSIREDVCFEWKRCGRLETRIESIRYENGIPNAGRLCELIGETAERVRGVGIEEPRIFISLNSWRRAFRLYWTIRECCEKLGLEPVLLTGKMTEADRIEATKRAIRGGVCLIATQVVEAGVDVDFHALITEAAPASQLIQRAGRVARHSKPGKEHVIVILEPKGGVSEAVRGVYDENTAKATLDELKSIIGLHGSFSWRCPTSQGPDPYTLVLTADHAIRFRLNGLLDEAKRVEWELEPLLYTAMTPREATKVIDDVAAGSFIRRSALAPLVAWSLLEGILRSDLAKLVEGACGNGVGILELPGISSQEEAESKIASQVVLALDLPTMARMSEEIVYTCPDRSPVALTYFCNQKSCWIAAVRLSSGLTNILESFSTRPLSTLRVVASEVSSATADIEDSERIPVRLLGILLAQDAYVSGLGLEPLEREETSEEPANGAETNAKRKRKSTKSKRGKKG